MKKIYTILLLVLFAHGLKAQIGGKGINSFLQMAPNARSTAMGEILIGIRDYDLGLAFSNPALLNEEMLGGLSFSQQFHFADISSSHANYAWKLPWQDLMIHTGFQVLSYGDFTAADVYGVEQGTFSARDLAMIVGIAKEFNKKVTVGLNTHFFNSAYENYSSSGIGIDLGVYYLADNKNLSFAAVIKNLDIQFSSFEHAEYAKPDLQLSITQKLSHLPFRFSIVAHNLQQWGIRYDDPSAAKQTDFLGQEQEENKLNDAVDNLFRHLIFSGEFLFGKKENFKIRFGYNHMKRQELSVPNFRSLAGFSGGLGIKIKGFRLDYGMAYYHLVGSSKQLTITTNLNRIFKKF